MKPRRTPHSFRATPELSEKIKSAAQRSGRSISQEIESLIEKAFEQDRIRYILRQELGRAQLAGPSDCVAEAHMPNMSPADRADWLAS